MLKEGRTPSTDPRMEKLIRDKADFNKQTSAFINDLIHFKKMMNGWPSKFFKERSKLSRPIPADPATIVGSLAGDFQELANKCNAIIKEQLDFSKTRRQKKPKAPMSAQTGQPLRPQQQQPPNAPEQDLSQQIGKPLAASSRSELIKMANNFEDKYFLEAEGSNPASRFVTRLFNPRFGFGEAARIRRLRMAMLDNCAKSYKELKRLHKEIVRSSKGSIEASHKIMTIIWNYWNVVNHLLSTYKSIRPDAVVQDDGGQLGSDKPQNEEDKYQLADVSMQQIKDYNKVSSYLFPITKSKAFNELGGVISSIIALPKDNLQFDAVLNASNQISDLYDKAINEINAEKNTNGSSFSQIVSLLKNRTIDVKKAQRQIGKVRHQILPGATSGQRLEIYRFIDQIKKDLDNVMNILEKGFDQQTITSSIIQVNREMVSLRTMIRSLYFSEKPEMAPPTFL